MPTTSTPIPRIPTPWIIKAGEIGRAAARVAEDAARAAESRAAAAERLAADLQV